MHFLPYNEHTRGLLRRGIHVRRHAFFNRGSIHQRETNLHTARRSIYIYTRTPGASEGRAVVAFPVVVVFPARLMFFTSCYTTVVYILYVLFITSFVFLWLFSATRLALQPSSSEYWPSATSWSNISPKRVHRQVSSLLPRRICLLFFFVFFRTHREFGIPSAPPDPEKRILPELALSHKATAATTYISRAKTKAFVVQNTRQHYYSRTNRDSKHGATTTGIPPFIL